MLGRRQATEPGADDDDLGPSGSAGGAFLPDIIGFHFCLLGIHLNARQGAKA